MGKFALAYAEAKERDALKREARALRKAKGSIVVLKVRTMSDLSLFLSRGWEVISSNDSSYGGNRFHILKIDRDTLEKRVR